MSTPCVGHFVSSIPYQEETKCPRKVRSLEHNYLCSSHCTSLFYLGRSIWRAHFYLRQEKPKKTVNPSFTVPLIWSTFTVSAPRDQIRNFPWQRLKEGSIGATLMNLNCRKGKLLPANRLIIWLRNPDLWGFSIKSFSLSLYLSLSSNVSKVRSNQDRSSKVLSNYICLCVSGKYVCPPVAFALDRK